MVKFYGPEGTPYEGGVWKVRVHMPKQYPFKPPQIRFLNKIYHPNVCDINGYVCLDVINQAWTEKYNLLMIFEYFLPQLLAEPNLEAATKYLQRPEEYKKKVSEYVQKYATKEALQVET